VSRSLTLIHSPRLAASLIVLSLGLGGPATVAAAPAPPAPAEAQQAHPNFSGIWEPISDALKPLARPAFTERATKAMNRTLTKGEAAWAEHGIDESDANCLPRRQPWMLIQSAPISIVHDGAKMILLYEKRSSPMHVYIDGRNHPDPATDKPRLNGHSIGRWEGDTLIVDSVGFADHPGHGPLNTLPYLPTVRITQKFRLEKNGEELHARFTIDDPQLFQTPYVYDFTWRRLPYATSYALVELCDARDPERLRY
jgi:hypothetical protein